jgi:uncharacterized protein YehS (DUF1456 family)
MTNNDILRRLRFALNQNDEAVIALFALGGQVVSPAELGWFIAKESDPEYTLCPEEALRAYFDGLILSRRGPRDPSAPRPKEGRLDNNLILRKLRIALDLKEPEMLAVLKKGGMEVSPSELGALFRSPSHKHFRPCGDQLLRNFLSGLTAEHRGLRA